MDAEDVREFIRHNHRAVVATVRADGRPQLSPITTDVDPEGRIRFSTRETAVKVKHLRTNPWVTVCLLSDGFFGDWATAAGTAEIVSLPEAMELLVDYYRSVSGEHPDWDDYRAAMERDRRVIVRFPIEYAGPSFHG